MDILAHALWTNLAYYKKYKYDLKDRLWAVFFGIMPDLISFTPVTLWAFFNHPRFDMQTALTSHAWVYVWARESYNYTHSLVSFAVVVLIVLAFRKGRMYWPLVGWFLHIFIDMFTHPDFYRTPIFYPLSNFHNPYGITWANPIFMLVNYTAIALLYIHLVTIWRRKNETKI